MAHSIGVYSNIEHWLEYVGIYEGRVFRGFYKGNKTVRKTGLTTHSIQRILGKYPIVIKGEARSIKPHDLRRTYAKLLHDSGMALLYISQNLGHASIETTKIYIGDEDYVRRKPSNILAPPHQLTQAGYLQNLI